MARPVSNDTGRPIRVLPYSVDILCELFAEATKGSADDVRDKGHLHYFEEYFIELGAQTVVVETRYTDRDWVEDYAAFYVRCMEGKYSSRCYRLHFFDISFTDHDLREAVGRRSTSLDEAKLKDHYLGFIVVKPLPRTFIGRTCLKTYPTLGEERAFPVTRDYQVHLLGFDLTVEKSLAFQEQDTIAAACATSALWSAFHGTGIIFQHAIPSPIEITRTATATQPSRGRDIPNRGLSLLQMSDAVRRVGLEPEFFPVDNAALLRATVYAYLRARIPILLMAQLLEISDAGKRHFYQNNPEGAHAVVVTGYRTGHPECSPYGRLGTLFESERINKLYVHDDQIGPFARVTFREEQKPIQLELPDGSYQEVPVIMDCSWLDDNGRSARILFAPYGLIVPLYHKIRLPFEEVFIYVQRYDGLIESQRRRFPSLFPERLKWEVFLTTIGELKSDLRQNFPEPQRVYGLLQEPWPRYIWRAIGSHLGSRVLERHFDATDIAQGDFVLGDPLLYDERVAALLPTRADDV